MAVMEPWDDPQDLHGLDPESTIHRDTASSIPAEVFRSRAPSAMKPKVQAQRSGPSLGTAAALCKVQPWWIDTSPGRMLPVP